MIPSYLIIKVSFASTSCVPVPLCRWNTGRSNVKHHLPLFDWLFCTSLTVLSLIPFNYKAPAKNAQVTRHGSVLVSQTPCRNSDHRRFQVPFQVKCVGRTIEAYASTKTTFVQPISTSRSPFQRRLLIHDGATIVDSNRLREMSTLPRKADMCSAQAYSASANSGHSSRQIPTTQHLQWKSHRTTRVRSLR